MSHELRTVLADILGACEVLLDDDKLNENRNHGAVGHRRDGGVRAAGKQAAQPIAALPIRDQCSADSSLHGFCGSLGGFQ